MELTKLGGIVQTLRSFAFPCMMHAEAEDQENDPCLKKYNKIK